MNSLKQPESHQPKPPKTLDELLILLESAQTRGYIGEAISQLEHALQAAKIAVEMNASDEFILAALFHDIGHLCDPENASKMGEYGRDGHHKWGAEILRQLGFSETTAQLVEGHVEAKRYLVGKNPRYLNDLSHASQETLKLQGGPMSAHEIESFEADPLFKEKLRLRICDDRAKEVNCSVFPLSYYRRKMNAYSSMTLNL